MLALSIVIPHYGDPEPTRQLVRTLRRQDFDESVEIIVVDDHSPTPLRAIEGARVIRRTTNGGFGAAVNQGVQAATAPLLLILNSDVLPTDQFVRVLMERARPWMPAVVSPWAVWPDGSADYPGRVFPRPRHRLTERLHPLYRIANTALFNRLIGRDRRARAGVDVVVDWVAGFALLMPREVFIDVGGFDERYFMYCEEVDLQRRLRLAGVPSVCLGSVSLIHDAAGSTDPARVAQWTASSQLIYARTWGSVSAFRAALTIAALINLVWDGVRGMCGRPIEAVPEFRRAIQLAWRPVSSDRITESGTP